ncbi:MAG: DMT family transporter [Rhodospirillaceae bacterium]|nr:DMT family transporter [Rhodospirillaceae bacterium]MBT6117704.1 DMT family transporter [Rhodospirillaceae bacterium]
MSGALASFALMGIAGRELSAEIGAFQIVFFRSAVATTILFVLAGRRLPVVLRTTKLKTHLIRNTIHFAGQWGWFYGISVITLAEVFAIEFTTPIWTALLAALFLGEKIDALRAVSIAVGFAGIVIILRPGMTPVEPAALIVLAAAFAYATAFAMTKYLTRWDDAFTIVFYMNLIQLPLGLATALPGWVTPSPALWPWVAAVGVVGITAHYCLTRAFVLADASLVAPLDFMRLPLIAVVGWLAYDEVLDPYVLLGAVVIFGGNYLNIRSGRRRRKKP